MNKTVSKSIIYNSIGTMIYLFCQWLVTFVVIWLSGYSAAGVLSLAMSVTNTFSVISTFNMRNFQASDVKNKYNEKIYLFSRVITILIATFTTFCYTIIKNFSFFEVICINCYMLYKMTEAIVDVLHGTMQKKWKFNIIGLSYSIRGILTITLFSIGLIFTNNLFISILLMTIGIFIFILLFDIKMYRNEVNKLGTFDLKKMISLLLNCLPLVIFGVISNYTSMIPRVFVAQKYGEKILGYYAAVATPALIVQIAASFVFNPLITFFADYYEKKDMTNLYKNMFKVIVAIFTIGIVGLLISTFFSDYILNLLYGEDILKYSYLFNEIILISVLTAFIWFLGMIITIVRNYGILLLGAFVSLLSCIVFTPIFISNYSLNGVNYTLIISYLLEIIIFIIYILMIGHNYNKSKNKIIYLRSTSIVNDSRASKEITTLLKNNLNVHVLGWDRERIIKDYKNVKVNEEKIKTNFFKFKTAYGGTKKTVLGIILFQIWLFIKLIKNHNKYEYIHACDFDTGYTALLISKIYNKKLVYDMYDYYSESRQFSHRIEKIIKREENRIVNNSYTSIICAEWRKSQIKDTKPKHLVVIHNTPDLSNISHKKIIKSKNNKIKIAYVGILQNHRLILEIANIIKEKKNYEFHVGGFGEYENDIKTLALKYDNIYYYGSLKYSDVLALEKDTDVLFATYDPNIKNHKYSAPNKVYEAMALEKPLIVCKNTGIDKMVSQEGIGRTIEYDANDFINKLDNLFKNKKELKSIKEKEKQLYKEKYNWSIMQKRLIEIYKETMEE